MRQKRSILLLLFIIQAYFVFGQEWTDNKIIYIDNTTMESANPEKVEIEFKWASCIELNLGKKENVLNGKSYYRLKTNISKKKCTISGKLDYADCNGNISTHSFSRNLDDWMSLNGNNKFDGIKLIKVYDIIVTGCKLVTEKEIIDPGSNAGQTSIDYSESDSKEVEKGFYFFCVIDVPTDKGVFQIFTAPLYNDGDSPDNKKLKADVLHFYDNQLKKVVLEEAKKILERELSPQLKKASADDIEKKTQEILNQIKNSLDERLNIWTKTVNINYLAKSVEKSREQIQEVISTMQSTIQGIGIDNPELNKLLTTASKDYYRYIILHKPTPKDLKFTPRNKSGTGGGGIRG